MTLAQYPEYADEYKRLTALIDGLQLHGEPQIRWIHRATQRIVAGEERLGIFSSSFNPLTVAHARMIETARADYNLKEILLLLAKANVDKEVFGLTLAERLLTLKLYASSRENVSVAVCSHGRFIEKLRALQAAHNPNTDFSFIVGYDTFVRIFDAKYYTDIHADLEFLFGQCRLIVANRESHNSNAVMKFLERPEVSRYATYIDLIELPGFYADISSTQIRTQIERGVPINSLVPQCVGEFLSETHAYRSK